MDFNTGSGGPQRPGNDPPPPPSSSGFSPPRSSVGSGTGDYNLSDPVGSFIRTTREVVLNPTGFFRSMPRSGNFINPMVYALICYFVYALLAGIIGLVFGSVTAIGGGTAGDQAAGVASTFGSFILGIVLAPIIAALILFITAGVRHLLVVLLAGAGNSGFEATMRVQSYTFVTRLIWWIPILGSLIGFVYGLVLSVIGIREVHSTTTGRAAIIVLIPVAIALVLFLLLALAIGAAVFQLLQQQA
jgi:hypothetical protein